MSLVGVRFWTALTVLSLILVVAVDGGRADGSESSRPTSFESFLKAPSLSLWVSFENDVRAGIYGPPESVFHQVLEFHAAREKRDLPNSMALSGISPDEFVKLQAVRADSALVRIRRGQTTELWRLLQTLAGQTFDDGLVFTSAELGARLDPSRFEEIAAAAVKTHPDNSWIFEKVRDRWLRGRKE